ncbi:MAG TPA: hypothetical protein PLY72_13125 [Candidatus Obscuribacter sp.]|nr:hypothetical protein [Candidatus Obscuribacter sp.]
MEPLELDPVTTGVLVGLAIIALALAILALYMWQTGWFRAFSLQGELAKIDAKIACGAISLRPDQLVRIDNARSGLTTQCLYDTHCTYGLGEHLDAVESQLAFVLKQAKQAF